LGVAPGLRVRFYPSTTIDVHANQHRTSRRLCRPMNHVGPRCHTRNDPSVSKTVTIQNEQEKIPKMPILHRKAHHAPTTTAAFTFPAQQLLSPGAGGAVIAGGGEKGNLVFSIIP